jgi:putative GTP pyrophosphokinase
MTSNSPETPGFDFEGHARRAADDYQKRRTHYESFAEEVKDILSQALRARALKVASVEARAKSVDSFAEKAAAQLEADPTKPRYPNPLGDITDLAAARVITFFISDIPKVEELINTEFLVVERTDKADALLKEDRLGYQSVHYIVQLRDTRTRLPEYSRYAGLKAELQVRTVLQHAWAEIEHDIQYKSVETIPSAIRRRFTSLAGLLELADREFQAIQADDERLREQARRSVDVGNLSEVEVTADALKRYLDKRLGPDARMRDYSYDATAKHLRRLGFSNFAQVEKAIAPYDHDALSRKVYGGRQGQLTRFEDMMIAAIGQDWIDKHEFAHMPWWKNWREHHLAKIGEKGIQIGTYKLPPS